MTQFYNAGQAGGLLREYEFGVILRSMKVGERGQITIPKPIREQFGIGPRTEVEFEVVEGSIILKKKVKKMNLEKWRGYCKKRFEQLGNPTVDELIEDMRGR